MVATGPNTSLVWQDSWHSLVGQGCLRTGLHEKAAVRNRKCAPAELSSTACRTGRGHRTHSDAGSQGLHDIGAKTSSTTVWPARCAGSALINMRKLAATVCKRKRGYRDSPYTQRPWYRRACKVRRVIIKRRAT